MFNSQLLFFVAVALISHSEARQSATQPPASDAWKYYATGARSLIRSSLGTVQGFPGAPGNQSLSQAEQSIAAALNKTDRADIISGLGSALVSDINALSEVTNGCKKQESIRGICNIVCAGVKLSTDYLLKAIEKLNNETLH